MYIRSSWYLLPQAGNVKDKFLGKVQKLAKNGHISASRVPENPKNARLHWFWVQTVHWVEFHQNRSRWPYPGVWLSGKSALKRPSTRKSWILINGVLPSRCQIWVLTWLSGLPRPKSHPTGSFPALYPPVPGIWGPNSREIQENPTMWKNRFSTFWHT